MERNKTIDLLKGIGILFVIMGHIQKYIPKELLIYIYSFHMPLFFYISGYLYKQDHEKMSIKEYMNKRAKQLLYPYITLYFINLIWLIIKNRSIRDVIKSILAFGYSNYIFDMNYVGAIWFLMCLFVVEILYFILKKKNKTKVLNIGVTFCLVLGIIFSQLIKYKYFRLPYWIDIALFGIIFYYIGQKTRTILKKINTTNKKKILLLIFCIILNIIFILLNYKYCNNDRFEGRTDMLYLYFGNYVYYILSAITGIYTWQIIASLIKTNKLIEAFGKNTLLIMGLHIIIYQIIDFLNSKLNLINNNIIIFTCSFILVSILSLLISSIIKKYFSFIINVPVLKKSKGRG